MWKEHSNLMFCSTSPYFVIAPAVLCRSLSGVAIMRLGPVSPRGINRRRLWTKVSRTTCVWHRKCFDLPSCSFVFASKHYFVLRKKHGVSVEPSFFSFFECALSVIGAEVRAWGARRATAFVMCRKSVAFFFEVDVLYTWTSLTFPCTIMNLSIYCWLSSIIDIIMYRCFFFFGIRLYSDVHHGSSQFTLDT